MELLGHGEAGLLAWQMIAHEVFSKEQKDLDYAAISYAILDRHDYLNVSCDVNVDSIEVFFPAIGPTKLIAFVDEVLAFEIAQEAKGRSFVGYMSLRFTGQSQALLGQERHPCTCAVEVAGLRDVDGVTQLIDFAIALALDPNFKGILHWGQRNESTRAHIQERFGDTASAPTGDLRKWRNVLSRFTRHGKLDGFSSAFTRRTGLEIVTPQIGSLKLVGAVPQAGKPMTIGWDCDENPPGTTVTLDVLTPSAVLTSSPVALVGQKTITAQQGTFKIGLVAAIDLAGEKREVNESLVVTVP